MSKDIICININDDSIKEHYQNCGPKWKFMKTTIENAPIK